MQGGRGRANLPQAAHLRRQGGGRFGKQDFVYQPQSDTYRCPAGETLTRRFSSLEHGLGGKRTFGLGCEPPHSADQQRHWQA